MTIEELFEKSGKEYLSFNVGKGIEMLNVEQLKKRLSESIPIEPPVILPEPNPTCEKFIVRLYDGFDNGWMDVTEPITKEEAEKVWNEKTDNGKHHKSFDDIDYYAIFPADTKMVYKL